MIHEKYISLGSVAGRLNLPERYIKELSEQGKIPFLLVGKRKRYREDDVRAGLIELAAGKRNPLTNAAAVLERCGLRVSFIGGADA